MDPNNSVIKRLWCTSKYSDTITSYCTYPKIGLDNYYCLMMDLKIGGDGIANNVNPD